MSKPTRILLRALSIAIYLMTSLSLALSLALSLSSCIGEEMQLETYEIAMDLQPVDTASVPLPFTTGAGKFVVSGDGDQVSLIVDPGFPTVADDLRVDGGTLGLTRYGPLPLGCTSPISTARGPISGNYQVVALTGPDNVAFNTGGAWFTWAAGYGQQVNHVVSAWNAARWAAATGVGGNAMVRSTGPGTAWTPDGVSPNFAGPVVQLLRSEQDTGDQVYLALTNSEYSVRINDGNWSPAQAHGIPGLLALSGQPAMDLPGSNGLHKRFTVLSYAAGTLAVYTGIQVSIGSLSHPLPGPEFTWSLDTVIPVTLANPVVSARAATGPDEVMLIIAGDGVSAELWVRHHGLSEQVDLPGGFVTAPPVGLDVAFARGRWWVSEGNGGVNGYRLWASRRMSSYYNSVNRSRR